MANKQIICIIICGDFGLLWDNSEYERKKIESLNNLAQINDVEILFIDGNHENYKLLNSYKVSDWHGGNVHIIRSNIIHLMRGQIFDIDGIKLFAFGGAASVDKELRSSNSWWEEEIPNQKEYEIARKNLSRVNYKVDYIVTHQCPKRIIALLGSDFDTSEAVLIDFLDKEVLSKVTFRKWFFGHQHIDKIVSKKLISLNKKTIFLRINTNARIRSKKGKKKLALYDEDGH